MIPTTATRAMIPLTSLRSSTTLSNTLLAFEPPLTIPNPPVNIVNQFSSETLQKIRLSCHEVEAIIVLLHLSLSSHYFSSHSSDIAHPSFLTLIHCYPFSLFLILLYPFSFLLLDSRHS